jgi:hypothetical protein
VSVSKYFAVDNFGYCALTFISHEVGIFLDVKLSQDSIVVVKLLGVKSIGRLDVYELLLVSSLALIDCLPQSKGR